MKRLLMTFIAAATAAGAVYGAAASLGGVQTNNIAADTTAITPCDSDGVRVRWGDAGYSNQTSVVYPIVDHIADACAGLVIKVTLFNSLGGVFSSEQNVLPAANPGSPNDIEFTTILWIRVRDVHGVEVLIQEPAPTTP